MSSVCGLAIVIIGIVIVMYLKYREEHQRDRRGNVYSQVSVTTSAFNSPSQAQFPWPLDSTVEDSADATRPFGSFNVPAESSSGIIARERGNRITRNWRGSVMWIRNVQHPSSDSLRTSAIASSLSESDTDDEEGHVYVEPDSMYISLNASCGSNENGVTGTPPNGSATECPDNTKNEVSDTEPSLHAEPDVNA